MADQDSSILDNNNDSSDNVVTYSSIITTTTTNDDEDNQARIAALLESIASIPPVVCIILSNLSYRDYLSCLRVCKLWSAISQGYLWRYVAFHDTLSENAIPTPAEMAVIRRRAHRIRNLALPLANTSLLDMPCTQLQSLEIWANTRVYAHRRLHKLLAQGSLRNTGDLFSHPQILYQEQQLVPSALSLIPKNPYLSHIHLEQFENLIPVGYPSQELFRVVNIYKNLREIEILVGFQEEYPIIPTMILQSGMSLEVIDLGVYCAGGLIVRNTYISIILQACRQLKRLSVHNRGTGKSCICLRDLVETNWASNQLESLGILVSEASYNASKRGQADIAPDKTYQCEQEDTAMLLFQLSMKYHAQKKYTGPPPTWWEVEAKLLSYESAVKFTDGAMDTAAWRRIRLET
ncbi:hypothetical protein BGZ95_000440 [Linnemannia exigua]|uniref:F-box domain-containing protein n=1 Tax=Linnemannia exigua TaxID=604196 RepID=A0AAD4DJC5_9FUNG|nr:hypothetical protein BGZ95_000440 [Linnemannia exigua]